MIILRWSRLSNQQSRENTSSTKRQMIREENVDTCSPYRPERPACKYILQHAWRMAVRRGRLISLYLYVLECRFEVWHWLIRRPASFLYCLKHSAPSSSRTQYLGRLSRPLRWPASLVGRTGKTSNILLGCLCMFSMDARDNAPAVSPCPHTKVAAEQKRSRNAAYYKKNADKVRDCVRQYTAQACDTDRENAARLKARERHARYRRRV